MTYDLNYCCDCTTSPCKCPDIEVEMYYGYYLGNAKLWDTQLISIPGTTDLHDFDKVAEEVLIKEFKGSNIEIAFCGIYSMP